MPLTRVSDLVDPVPKLHDKKAYKRSEDELHAFLNQWMGMIDQIHAPSTVDRVSDTRICGWGGPRDVLVKKYPKRPYPTGTEAGASVQYESRQLFTKPSQVHRSSLVLIL
jgi:hypothetical protein